MILFLKWKKIENFAGTITIICFFCQLGVINCAETMTTSSDDQQLFRKEAEACRLFSSRLYKSLAIELKERNIVSSPLSIHILLSYLTHGAKEQTAEEMISHLSISDIEKLHIGYKSLIASLNNTTKAALHIANSVFLHTEFQLIATFSSIGTDFYNFTHSNVDFKKSSDAANEINSWVMKKTNDKITDIITSDDITDDTQLILVNAIYFKGSWLFPFDVEKTSNRDFHVTPDSVKRVPTMTQKKRYRHGELPEVKAKYIEIPYSDEDLSMVIILPNDVDGLTYLEKNFDWNLVLTADHSQRETVLHLPKFKIECKINVKEILQKVGFLAMFEDTANFTGMSPKPLKVSKILQKAFIEVNEHGTEAAAATVAQIRLRRMIEEPDEFNVDRPFMVVIRHKPSDIPLFIGSIRDIGESTDPKDEL